MPTIWIWQTTPIHAPPHVPSLRRRITTLMSGRTPVPGSALYRHPQRATTGHAWLPLSGLPSDGGAEVGIAKVAIDRFDAARSAR